MSGTGEAAFSDGVVVLRPLRIGDAADHLAGEDAELVRWLNGGPGTLESVVSHIEQVEHMWANHGAVFTFAIRLAVEGNLIGTVDVQLRQDALPADQANLAYGLYHDWRGHGYATRAVRLAVEFLRAHATVRSAVIRVLPANVASAAVAVRAGFRLAAPAAGTNDGHDWYGQLLHPPDDASYAGETRLKA